MIAVTDSTVDGLVDYFARPLTSSGAHLWPGRIHGGGANALFCDSHVTWYPQNELLVDDAEWFSRPHEVRRWNNDNGL
jgi:prepilin-type processing-associated H-X9-DG protein